MGCTLSNLPTSHLQEWKGLQENLEIPGRRYFCVHVYCVYMCCVLIGEVRAATLMQLAVHDNSVWHFFSSPGVKLATVASKLLKKMIMFT